MTKIQVLSAYKHLLRVQQKTFAGDVVQIKNARQATRQEFYKHSNLLQEQDIQKQLKLAEQVALILQRNVVQGQQKAQDSTTFVLRIDKDTEINDNDTIKGCGGQRQPAQPI